MRGAVWLLLMATLAGCAGGRYTPPVEDRAHPEVGAPAGGVVVAEPPMVSPPPAADEPDRGASAPARRPTDPLSPAVVALLDQASRYETAGQRQQALAYLERAQRISPREPQVYLQLARVRLAMNDVTRAVQLTERGLALAPSGSQVQEQLLQLKRQLGERH
ncbi:tetratricopeptide repeat protein [Motiliproteus sediminis]|uniref:tetratricopeptide repeat protein n=1 Tax=Motiliproteus sediminis TaxID=1468178 RepID=UPI001FE7CD65|nr:tetratricopeptide repeat protein [Motiliproteus sediminis]